MASKYPCVCGQQVRTNLYEGHGLGLLVPEELTESEDASGASLLDDFLTKLVGLSQVVAKCPSCGALGIVDKDYNVSIYQAAASRDQG